MRESGSNPLLPRNCETTAPRRATAEWREGATSNSVVKSGDLVEE